MSINRRTVLSRVLKGFASAALAGSSASALAQRSTRGGGSYARSIYVTDLAYNPGQYVSVTEERDLRGGATSVTNYLLSNQGELVTTTQIVNQDGQIAGQEQRVLTSDGQYLVDGRSARLDQERIDRDMRAVDSGINTILRDVNNQRYRIGHARQDFRIITNILAEALIGRNIITDVIDRTFSLANFRDKRERNWEYNTFVEEIRGDYWAFKQTMEHNADRNVMRGEISEARSELCTTLRNASSSVRASYPAAVRRCGL